MRLLLYPFVILYNIIRRNIAKAIWILIAILSFNFSNNYSEDIIEKSVASYVIKEGNTYTYFFDVGDDKYRTMQTNKPLKNNTYFYKDTQEGYVLWRILAWVSIIIVSICSIIGWGGDDSAGWEIDDCIKESIPFLITCELEDGKYHYMALGRLIKISDKPRTDNILYHLDIRSFTDILNCPKFKTKRQNRSDKLDKILK
jgi:hypothetical protein